MHLRTSYTQNTETFLIRLQQFINIQKFFDDIMLLSIH